MLNWLLLSFIIALLVFLIRKSSFFRLPGLSLNLLSAIFFLRIIVAIAGWMLYSSHYPVNDANSFMHDSKVLHGLAFSSPVDFFRLLTGIDMNPELLRSFSVRTLLWSDSSEFPGINDSRTVIRINAIICFFSGGFFYIHAAIMAFLAFWGQCLLYRAVYPYLYQKKILLITGAFLLPAVLFWSSAVGKESLLFAGLGLLMYCSDCGRFSRLSGKKVYGLALAILILSLIKPYVLILLVPTAAAGLIAGKTRFVFLKYTAVIASFFLLLLLLSRVDGRFDVPSAIGRRQENYRKMAPGGVYLQQQGRRFFYVPYSEKDKMLGFTDSIHARLKKGNAFALFTENKNDTVWFAGNDSVYRVVYLIPPAGSNMALPDVSRGFPDLILHAPMACFNALVVPGLFSSSRPFTSITIADNLLVVLFFFCGILFRKKDDYDRQTVLFFLSFSLLLLALIGFTTPVVGAMLRYRIPALPFIFLASAMMFPQKIYDRLIGRLLKRV